MIRTARGGKAASEAGPCAKGPGLALFPASASDGTLAGDVNAQYSLQCYLKITS